MQPVWHAHNQHVLTTRGKHGRSAAGGFDYEVFRTMTTLRRPGAGRSRERPPPENLLAASNRSAIETTSPFSGGTGAALRDAAEPASSTKGSAGPSRTASHPRSSGPTFGSRPSEAGNPRTPIVAVRRSA